MIAIAVHDVKISTFPSEHKRTMSLATSISTFLSTAFLFCFQCHYSDFMDDTAHNLASLEDTYSPVTAAFRWFSPDQTGIERSFELGALIMALCQPIILLLVYELAHLGYRLRYPRWYRRNTVRDLHWRAGCAVFSVLLCLTMVVMASLTRFRG